MPVSVKKLVESKSTESKSTESKPDSVKKLVESKSTESKPVSVKKPVESKSTESKSTESKPVSVKKPVELKPVESSEKFPIILSFDVGVIHLAYCLMTKKEFIKPDGTKIVDWYILDWNNIDLTNRDEQKCHCGAKAKLSNMTDGEVKYYCKNHGKKIIIPTLEFDQWAKTGTKSDSNKCEYPQKTKENNLCGKSASFYRMQKDTPYWMCGTHAKQIYKSETKASQLKSFKVASSTALNFDDVKYGLLMELEKRPNLLKANYVVIENQPSFKNPRMKSIATTLYDYYLIRGVLDKLITNSDITQVKFMSPSNKLKLANDGDTKQLIKAKSTDDTAAYKLTKSLGIKYCLELTSHLETSQTHFNSHKKKDDLADAFLQGAYFYTNNIKQPKQLTKPNPVITVDLTNEIKMLESKEPVQLFKPVKTKKVSPKNIEL